MIKRHRNRLVLRIGRLSRVLAAFAFFALLLLILTLGIETLVSSRFPSAADFHTYWVAGRAMFLEGISPFAPEVTLRTQLAIYGREPLPGEDPLGFVYPPYSLLVVLPTVWMTYPWAQAFWIALNFTFLTAAVYLAFPSLPPWLLGTVVFFYPAGYGMVIGNFGVMIGAMFILIYALLRSGSQPSLAAQGLAGALLAWCTAKPQVTWLLLLFFLAYAVRYRLWAVWGGFCLTLTVCFVVTLWMVPSWPSDWIWQMMTTADEFSFPEPLALIYASWVVPDRLSVGVSVVLVLGSVLVTGRSFVEWWRGHSSALLVLAWVVVVTQLVHPRISSPDQVLMLLPMLLWASRAGRAARRCRNAAWGIALVVPWLLFFFPVLVLRSYDLTRYVVTKGPPLLFGLWAMCLLLLPEGTFRDPGPSWQAAAQGH